jgi:predicted transcriptional regulator
MNDNLLCNGLFGKTKQSVLALHYGHANSSFYTKQILDAVKSGRGTVQPELKNLTETGTIIRENQGRQVYYKANVKCRIFNELKIIVRKTFGMASTLSGEIANLLHICERDLEKV